MGKIRSAAEIAMEKTKHMTADKSDSGEKYQEYVKAAGVLASALIDNKTDPDAVTDALKRYPEEAKEPVRKVFFKYFSEGINFKNTPGVIKVITYLTGDEITVKSCEEALRLHESFRKKTEDGLKDAEETGKKNLRQKLALEGIRGSAIYRINPATSSSYSETVSSQIEEEYFTQLSGFRSFLAGKA